MNESDGRRRQVGRFEILREIAQGGMGLVYAGRDPKDGSLRAIKILLGQRNDAEARERFRREAEVIGSLQHPNIIRLFEAGEDHSHPYIVMELIEGGSLADRIATGPALSVTEAVEIVISLARALDHAHAHALVHRDIKPGNILLRQDGQPVLTDFGLVRLRREGLNSLTKTGEIVGTLPYMSPEQSDQSKVVDERADIYSLGATLYELLSGRTPFSSSALMDLVVVIATEPPARLLGNVPEVNAGLEAVLMRCLAKDPEDRYQVGEELAQDLERSLRGEPVEAPLLDQPGRLRNWAMTLGLLLFCGLSAAGLWTLSHRLGRPGHVLLSSRPPGLEIELTPVAGGRRRLLKTPSALDLPPGRYQLNMVGGKAYRVLSGLGLRELAAGQRRRWEIVTERRRGELLVEQRGAEIRVSAAAPGSKPVVARGRFAELRLPGRWRVEIRSPNKLPFCQEVELAADQRLRIAPKLRERKLWDQALDQGALPELLLHPGFKDSLPELVAFQGGGVLFGIQPSGALAWRIKKGEGVSLPRVAELRAGDGPRVLYLENRRDLIGMRGGTTKFRIQMNGDCRSLWVSDLDGDGDAEFLVINEAGLLCIDQESTLRWRVQERNLASALAISGGAGRPAIVVAAGPRRLIAFDHKGRQIWAREAQAVSDRLAPFPRAGKADGIVFTDPDAGLLRVLSGAGDELWSTRVPELSAAPCVVELDAEAGSEILLPVKEGALICLDSGGRQRWRRSLPMTPGAPCIGDLDGDGRAEILLPIGKSLVCFDSAGIEQWRCQFPSRVGRPILLDADGDQRPEVFVPDGRGRISCLIGAETPLRWRARANCSALDPICAAGNFVLGCQGQVLDRRTGAVVTIPELANATSAAWLEHDSQLLASTAEGVQFWSPGSQPRLRIELPEARTVAVAGGLILVGTAGGRLVAYSAEEQRPSSRWSLRCRGRIEAQPFGLDLSGNGAFDHFLILSSAGEAVLVTYEGLVVGRLQLDQPFLTAPVTAKPGISGRVILGGAGGRLIELILDSRGLRKRRSLELGRSLLGPLLVVPSKSAGPLILCHSWQSWLSAVGTGLERVEWASWAPNTSVHGIAAVDLDGDGEREVVVGRSDLRGHPQARGRALISDLLGRPRGELTTGVKHVGVLPGRSHSLFVLGGEIWGYGRWPRIAPRRIDQGNDADLAMLHLLGGAFELARREMRAGRPIVERVITAVASWHLGEPQPLDSLLEEDPKGLRKTLKQWLKSIRSFRDERAEAILRAPFKGPQTGPIKKALTELELRNRPGGLPRADLRRNESTAIRLFTDRGSFGSDRHKRGLSLPQGGRLAARFKLKQGIETAVLILRHQALLQAGQSFSWLRISIDGKTIEEAWAAPARSARSERIAIGGLDPGPHELLIECQRPGATGYALSELKIGSR